MATFLKLSWLTSGQVFGDDEGGYVRGPSEDGHGADRRRGQGDAAGGATEEQTPTDEEN